MPSEARQAKVARMLARLGPRAGAAARAVPMMLCALSAWHAGITQVVVVGERGSEAALELERELASHYAPFAIHVPVTPGANQEALAARLEFIIGMNPETAAAYVCQNFTCQEPVTRRSELAELLNTGP
jgi:uncharacterized protein